MTRHIWLAGLSLIGTTQVAHPAMLRPIGSLAASEVKLSDLFADLGAGIDRVIGPGPAPGGRIIVEAAQLAAIARQFGVDWSPASSADRVVLERPGRALGREEIIAPLHVALTSAGAPDDTDLEIPSFVPPMIAADARVEINVEQIDYHGDNGHFTAIIAINGRNVVGQKMHISGMVVEMVEVPVLTRRLHAGMIVRAEDMSSSRLRASRVASDVARNPEQVIGLALRRTIGRGQPLTLADLAKPVLVARGARVALRLQSGALIVSAIGQAMEAGGLGDRITILNPTSRAVIEAEVTGTGQVRILPDTVPIVPIGGTLVSSANLGAGAVLR